MALENILSQEIVQKLGWTLLHFVWQAGAVALVLAILMALLQKSTANLRYIIACAALGLIVLLPIVTMQLVPASAPQPIANIEPAPAPVISPAQQIREIPALEMTIPEGPVQHEIAGTAYNASWKQRAGDLLEPALPYIVSVWLFGVFGLSLWHLGGWAQLQRLRKKMVKQVDDSLHTKLRRLSERLRVKRAVQLLESALVQVPTVVGWLRPVILLPASALTGLSSEQLESLLAHELAHIRRYDYLINMLQTLVETLGFYHPAVWWVSHKIRIERENCCDDLAVGISGDRISYARALTSMEEIRGRRGELAVAAAGGNLLGRIRRLVAADSSENSHLSWVPSAIAIILIVALALPTTLALSRRSSNESHGLESSLLEKLADPEVDTRGQQILKQMAEVNRYWLVVPPSKVKKYSYDFNRHDSMGQSDESETIRVRNAASTKSAYRQGITYDSVLHKLLADSSTAIIHEIRENEQTIRLDFILREFTKITCGNGIRHQWGGYFTSSAKSGSLWLDAERKIPIRVESGPVNEYFSDFVATSDGHYVPLTININSGVMHFDWKFGFYEPGLWLFDVSHYGQNKDGSPHVVTSISNVNVNARLAVKMTSPTIDVDAIEESSEKDGPEAGRPAQFVTLALDRDRIECEGKTVTWDTLASVLAKVPGRWNGGLQLTFASDELSPRELKDAKIRASVLARELGFGYLCRIGERPPGSKDSPSRYISAGRFELGKDMPVGLYAGADFKQDRYRAQGKWVMDETGQHKEWSTVWIGPVRFSRTWIRNHVDARLKVSYESWPRAKWRIVVRLLDDKGNSLAQTSHDLDTGGYIRSGLVPTMSSDLSFSLGRWANISKAAAFEITVTPLPENEISSEPTAEFILNKMLEHRSKVKNLQYVAESNIWRDLAVEKVRIENQIKSMRERGAPERQLERLRQSRKEVPESRYQILKCTVDDEERVKIEQTGGTYDSSGRKVPREEKHVWAWNGVIATQFNQLREIPRIAFIRDKPREVTKIGHPWRGFTGIFCGLLEETIAADKQVSVDELKDGTYRIAFDYRTGGIVAIVDPSKGYTCPLRENYFNEQLYSRHTVTYEEVAEGIWFPVSGQIENYTANGLLYSKSTVKSSHIRINDPAFNESYFDVDMPKGATVRDEVHGKQYVVGSKRVYDLDERRKPSAEIEEVDPNSWQEKFYSIYRLEDGEVLKRIAPPFIPERRGYFLSVKPGRYSSNTYEELVSQRFNWEGKLSIRGARVGSGIPRLKSTLESVIGLGNRQYDIPPKILSADMSGDWIVRKDTPQEELLQALEQIVKDETSRDIDFVKQKVETEVIIAKGKYNFQILPNITDGKYVLISTNNADIYTNGGGGSGTLGKFLMWVGNRVGMNIIDQTEAEGVELSWRNHDSSELSRLNHDDEPYNQRLDLLLKNLTRQTGLTFSRETAPVEKWFISEKGTIKAPQKTDAKVESGEGRIEGRIIDINTGKGISSVQLAVVSNSSPASNERFACTSAEDGSFAIGGLQSGEYLLQGDFPSVDVDVVSGRCTNDVLIGINRRKAVSATKETTAKQQRGGQIIIGMRVIEMPANAMKDIFEANESISSELLIRHGHEISGRLLTLIQEQKDAKQITNPRVLLNNNETGMFKIITELFYIEGYESTEGEPGKLNEKVKQLNTGWIHKIKPEILEGGEKVHMELATKQQKPTYETRQYQPGYDYQIPSPPEIFATEMTAKNGEPVVICRLRPGEPTLCLIVTPSVLGPLPQRQPEPLLGKKLPEPDNIQNIDGLKKAEGKLTLICFWDMNQRPSRNLIDDLAKRENELAEKNVAVYLVHTSKAEPAKLKEWLDNQNVPFVCGSIENDADDVLFRWGVRAQPWLILTDNKGVVQAEGFGIEQLDGKLQAKSSDLPVEDEGKAMPTEQESTNQQTITGVVRDEQGKPVEGVEFRLLPGHLQDFTSNAEGKFEVDCDLQGWGSGDMTLYLVARHKQHNLATIVELDENVGTLDIKLKPGVVLFGKVVDPEGKGIAGAWITPYLRIQTRGMSMARPQQRTDSEGYFEIKAIPAGYEYDLWARANGYGQKNSKVIQTDDLVANCFDVEIITLPVANLSVSGIVVDANDEPVANAAVSYSGEGQPHHLKPTDSDGKFIFEQVCDGLIRINANTYGTIPLRGSVNTYGGATDVKVVVTVQGIHSFVPKQPPSLVGSDLPKFQGLGIADQSDDLKDTKILLCFFDMNQRPSRNFIENLARREKKLAEKDVAVLLVHTLNVEPAKLKQWLDSRKIPFACGNIEGDAEKVLFRWGVRAQPWLILTDQNKVVCAEGFSLEQLDEKLQEASKPTTAGTRIVHFPQDRAVGDLKVRDSRPDLDWDRGYLSQPGWSLLGPAQGDVSIPAGEDLRLEASGDVRDFSFLADLKPNDLQVLLLSHSKISEEDLVHLKGLKGLMALSMDSTHIENEWLAHLAALTSLKELSLFDTQISDAGLEHLSALKSLKRLNLFVTKIRGPGLKHLKNMTSLVLLDLAATPITDAALEHVAEMTWLRELQLQDTDITDEGLAHLKSLRSLEMLVLGNAGLKQGYSPITDEGLVHLKRLDSLKYLHLLRTHVTGTGLVHLRNLKALKTIKIAEIRLTARDIEYLKKTPGMSDLQVDGEGISEVDVKNMEMSLSDHKISVESGRINMRSATPSRVDTSIVKVECLVCEVFPDPKMDRETIIAIENLLSGKITLPDSPDAADLLRKAAGATAAVKDESAGDKRVTNLQFNTLFDMLVSRGYVKILLRPTLEVFDGGTAKVMSRQKVPIDRITMRSTQSNDLETKTEYEDVIDSIEITPNVLEDGNIILQVNLDLSLESAERGNEQTPIVSKRKISTQIRLSPGESGIISGMKQAGLLAEPDKDAKDSEAPTTEMLVILTPTIVEQVTEPPAEVEPDKTLSKLARNRAFFTQPVMRTININAERTNCLIDFDNDRVLSLPSVFNSRNRQQQQAWKQENGIDASASVSQGGEGLWGEEMAVIPVANEEFDRIYPSSFRTLLTQATPATPAVMTAIGQLPKTYVFKTRESGMGLLQILEVQRKSSPHYIKIRYKMVPRTSDADAKITSNRMLQDLGKAMVSFAGDHQRTLPNRMEDFAPYLRNKQDIEWLGQNVEYLGKGKSENDRPDTVIAYDRSLLQSQQATNVLFLDAHVEFLTPERLKELGIKKAATIMIDIKILTASDEFLKYISLDPNSVASSKGWSNYLVHSSGDSASFVIDQLHEDLLLRTIAARMRTHKDIQMLHKPQILAKAGKECEIHILESEYYMLAPPSEPNGSSDGPESKLNSIELGITLRLTPNLTPDRKNVELNFEWESRQLRGFKEHPGPDGNVQKIPQVDVESIKTPCTIPDGKTLLITGKKITLQKEKEPGKLRLADLPLIGGLFYSPPQVEETRNLLILVKPIINPLKKAPPEPLLTNPNDPLIKQLEEKFNRYDEQK